MRNTEHHTHPTPAPGEAATRSLAAIAERQGYVDFVTYAMKWDPSGTVTSLARVGAVLVRASITAGGTALLVADAPASSPWALFAVAALVLLGQRVRAAPSIPARGKDLPHLDA